MTPSDMQQVMTFPEGPSSLLVELRFRLLVLTLPSSLLISPFPVSTVLGFDGLCGNSVSVWFQGGRQPSFPQYPRIVASWDNVGRTSI